MNRFLTVGGLVLLACLFLGAVLLGGWPGTGCMVLACVVGVGLADVYMEAILHVLGLDR
ncbi:hypothetical protein [Bifidobacterium vansinderenii]|uniref:Uncharacterized protein n=1 Tax=Bifidobacterium vansinderenii TaxID=1984871 RepID=A0A229W198_9BIFI|nr:hypothetical protein [Bifidobacterium vansinderenii]OXN01625.1 hypothetical protein Tam10B_0067 [Bifidobacterium vansinderenii]